MSKIHVLKVEHWKYNINHTLNEMKNNYTLKNTHLSLNNGFIEIRIEIFKYTKIKENVYWLFIDPLQVHRWQSA